MSEKEFVIPGMSITREDVEYCALQNRYKLSDEKAHEIAMSLTDAQMTSIAEMFAQSFFDGTEMFPIIMKDVVEILVETDIIKVNNETSTDL